MNEPNYTLREFADRQSLVVQLADDIESQLNQAIKKKGLAIVALSGGSTPQPMLLELSQRALDWSKIVITLVDERCVGLKHDLSNAAMLSKYLLDRLPKNTEFVPLYREDVSARAQLSTTIKLYCQLTQSTPDAPASFDVVVLGMGADGHTASFFPDADNIEQLVDINSQAALLTCESASTQVPRITWSLPMLLNSKMLVLHVTGENKRQVLEQAFTSQDKKEMPIRAAIFQSITPLDIYYSA